MSKRIINLQTAIDECRMIKRKFEWEWAHNHIKFYIEGCEKVLIMSAKGRNPDKVRKDIKRLLTANPT